MNFVVRMCTFTGFGNVVLHGIEFGRNGRTVQDMMHDNNGGQIFMNGFAAPILFPTSFIFSHQKFQNMDVAKYFL